MLLLAFTNLLVCSRFEGVLNQSVLRSSFQFLDILSEFLKQNLNLAIIRAGYGQLSCAVLSSSDVHLAQGKTPLLHNTQNPIDER